MKKNGNIVHAEEVFNPERTIVGYTTKEHLILDLDKAHTLYATEKLVRLIQSEYSDVGDCLISQSSHDGYHCIFDDQLAWKRIMQISATLTGLQIVNRNFTKVRTFREDLTLRISSIDRGLQKSEAPKPILIHTTEPDILTCGQKPILSITDILHLLHYKKFSGISEYLECLSAFREIEPIPIT